MFLDVHGQSVIDFLVTRHRLLLPRRWIEIDVMSRPITVKDAAGGCELAD